MPGEQRPAAAGRGDEDLAAGAGLRPAPSTASRQSSGSTRRWRRRATSSPGRSRCASSSTTRSPRTSRPRGGCSGRCCSWPTAATPGWTPRRRHSRSSGTSRTPPPGARRAGAADRGLQARLPAEEQRLAQLRERYAASALHRSPTTSPRRGARLEAAEAEIAEARGAAAGQPGRRSATCGPPRTPSRRPARCSTRSAGWPPNWTARRPGIAAVRAETEKDLAEARALRATGDRAGCAADRPGRGGARPRPTRRWPPGERPDPLAALRQLEEADVALEQALRRPGDAPGAGPSRRGGPGPGADDRASRRSPRPATSSATRRGAVGPGRAPGWPRRSGTSTPRVGAGRGRPGHGAARGAAGRPRSPSRRWTRRRTTSTGWGGGYGGGPRRLRRRVRRRVPAAAASTSAAWCSAASCSAADVGGGSAVASVAAGASEAAGAAAAGAAAVAAAWAAAASDRRPGQLQAQPRSCP